MKIITKSQTELRLTYDLGKICEPDKLCFLDIEATGLSAHSSHLYLIGLVTVKDGVFETTQYFAESYNDEPLLLKALAEFIKDYTHLVHFNGNTFDIPYLAQKYKQFGMENPLEGLAGVDLYRRIRSFKKLLNLPDAKQKSVELLLNTGRKDEYTGGELIKVYNQYLLSADEQLLSLLLLHNEEDIKGLVSICVFLSLSDIITQPQSVNKVALNTYTDYEGNSRKELFILLKLSENFPLSLSAREGDIYMSLDGNELKISVPALECELKYFYADYKNYYYLPAEDAAFHKSVAAYVAKEHREKCTRGNCYTKRSSVFVREYSPVIEPVFKKSYEDSEIYFELTDEIKKDRDAFSRFASDILSFVAYNAAE